MSAKIIRPRKVRLLRAPPRLPWGRIVDHTGRKDSSNSYQREEIQETEPVNFVLKNWEAR